ncbi:unnamed protein product [Hermetia illucens]|uniref:Uncharacterized protein n=1 Tax=Hermetia illucens TaxID=343691 RepID=A0A7R8V275_HERIL|nr:unnamed protein product [Hermetia illucens]
MDYNKLSSFISSIPPFDGSQSDLYPFIRAIDAIKSDLNHSEFKVQLTQQILLRITGRAREAILTYNPSSWDDVKRTLITHFDTAETELQLQERLCSATFTTASRLYDYFCTPVNYTMNPQWLNQQPQYQMGNNNSRFSNNSQINNNPSRNRGSTSRNYHNQPVDHSLPTDRSMNTVNSNNTSLHIHDTGFSFTCLGLSKTILPILKLTINGHLFRCLIDTGSSTSIMSAAKVQYSSREKLREPAYLHTLDGKIECTELIRTFAPEEFGVKAIMNWKIANISFQNVDAIIGMDILVALGASIDISRSELKINGNVIPFATDIPTQIIQEFSNAIDNIETQIDQQPDPNTHSIEEVELIERIKNEFHDLEYDSNKKLTFTHEMKHTLKLKTDYYKKWKTYP